MKTYTKAIFSFIVYIRTDVDIHFEICLRQESKRRQDVGREKST